MTYFITKESPCLVWLHHNNISLGYQQFGISRNLNICGFLFSQHPSRSFILARQPYRDFPVFLEQEYIALTNQNAFFVSAIYYHFLLTAQVTLVPHLLFCAADEPQVKNLKLKDLMAYCITKGSPCLVCIRLWLHHNIISLGFQQFGISKNHNINAWFLFPSQPT